MEQIFDLQGNRYWVLSIPKDGDCLFGSLVHQIYGITPKNALFKPYSRQLREIAVRQLRNRREKYYGQIAAYADELVRDALPLAEKIEQYLRLLETSGYWGGAECIASLSDFFEVNIQIFQDNACIRFSPEAVRENLPTYQIFYHGVDGARTHYDSIVCIRPDNYTLSRPSPSHPFEVVRLADRDFEAECTTMISGHDCLIAAVGHQLTGVEITEGTVALWRCLVADEIQAMPSSVVTSLGIPASGDDFDTYLYYLKTGHHPVGRSFLILFSALMNITICLHSTIKQTVRLAPAHSESTVTINLMEIHDQGQLRYASLLKVRQYRMRASSDVHEDPLIVAEKYARVEIDATPEVWVPPAPIDQISGLRFASLNVRGCRDIEKRNAIDSFLLSKKVHVAVLQEVNLQGSEAMTPHYRWYVSEKSANRNRGLALLVRIGASITVNRRRSQGPNIELADISYQVMSVKQSTSLYLGF